VGRAQQIPVIAQHTGADSASVIFDAVQAAKARGVDVLIADTAGRLHTKDNLMEELKKVRRVIGKLDAERRTRCCWCSTPAPARTPSARPSTSTRASS
jgi:signal recognition particle GTPase